MNGVTDAIIAEFGPGIDKPISPGSTFKIALSLMGYDALVLKDETHPVWHFQEGYDDAVVFWKAPQSPLSWMQYSCVWYSKVLSFHLGLKKIENYLASMEYGNQDASHGLIDPGPLNPFWIDESLKISPKEQVVFLQKMLRNQLPVSSYATQMTKAILFRENLPEGWKLFGKTGWSGPKNAPAWEYSWFVGWIEKDHSFYLFAYLIHDQKINLDQRLPRIKQLLTQVTQNQ